MRTRLIALSVASGLLFAAANACAQWVWIDAKGTRNYSDTPPPANKRVKLLSAPSGMQQAMAAEAAPASASAQTAPQSDPTLAEREADFRQRRKESAEAEAKAAEDARVRKENEKNCAIAIAAKARYESGNRIRSEKAQDMREPMGDEERSAALAKANEVLADCRKAGVN